MKMIREVSLGAMDDCLRSSRDINVANEPQESNSTSWYQCTRQWGQV